MTTKRISMVIPDNHPGVHDGMGGVHMAGSHPTLPAAIADAFIASGVAVNFASTGLMHDSKIMAFSPTKTDMLAKLGHSERKIFSCELNLECEEERAE